MDIVNDDQEEKEEEEEPVDYGVRFRSYIPRDEKCALRGVGWMMMRARLGIRCFLFSVCSTFTLAALIAVPSQAQGVDDSAHGGPGHVGGDSGPHRRPHEDQ